MVVATFSGCKGDKPADSPTADAEATNAPDDNTGEEGNGDNSGSSLKTYDDLGGASFTVGDFNRRCSTFYSICRGYRSIQTGDF